jgi:hypothetical protein
MTGAARRIPTSTTTVVARTSITRKKGGLSRTASTAPVMTPSGDSFERPFTVISPHLRSVPLPGILRQGGICDPLGGSARSEMRTKVTARLRHAFRGYNRGVNEILPLACEKQCYSSRSATVVRSRARLALPVPRRAFSSLWSAVTTTVSVFSASAKNSAS